MISVFSEQQLNCVISGFKIESPSPALLEKLCTSQDLGIESILYPENQAATLVRLHPPTLTRLELYSAGELPFVDTPYLAAITYGVGTSAEAFTQQLGSTLKAETALAPLEQVTSLYETRYKEATLFFAERSRGVSTFLQIPLEAAFGIITYPTFLELKHPQQPLIDFILRALQIYAPEVAQPGRLLELVQRFGLSLPGDSHKKN